ncbi:MAG TPA: hypothetical protein VFB13_03420 [Reyranella sp.]|nr:hypothetical protein [Reyranella sp.]
MNRLLIAASTLLALFGALPARAGEDGCTSLSVGVWDIGPTKADLSLDLDRCLPPQQQWFEVGTKPDLADALRIDAVPHIYPTGFGANLKLGELSPRTTYYVRGMVRWPAPSNFKITGEIRSFRTIAATDIRPECKFESQETKQLDINAPRWIGRYGVEVNYRCYFNGLIGIAHYMVSHDPRMTGAREIFKDNSGTRPPPAIAYPMAFFLPSDEYPDDTTLYVQAIPENNLGVGPPSEIVKVVLRRQH